MHHTPSVGRAPEPEMSAAQRPPGRRAQVEALFDAAADLEPTARRKLLDARCAGQPSLRHEVSRLLAYARPTTLDPAGTRDSGRGWSPSRVIGAFDASGFEPPDWMRPGTSIGQYELIRRLGVGGMSTVFLARDTQLGRRVAMKFLHRADHCFENEARVTARCEHPHIVRIYGLGAWRGCSFMVLEYMPGRTLRAVLAEHIERSGPGGSRGLPLRQVCEILLPVARALEAAHSQGVVHCDLKPENIILSDDGTAKVLDFGIARLVEGAPRPGVVVGTPAYMSPEQLRGEALDHRTDLWSMGVMLYEMLTGRRPFDDLQSQLDALLDHAASQPIPTAGVAELDRLEPLVRACLERAPDERPASAEALVEALSDPQQRRRAPIDEAHVFAGLAPFQSSDAASFFGRDAEVEAVVGRLRREPRLVVIGPSGVGKSSLIRAGVGPALASEGWQVLVVRPGNRPLDALSGLLAEVDPPPARVPSPSTLAAERGRFGHVLRQAARARRARILVVVDQLEEVFADEVEPTDRRAFFGCLDGAADEPSAPLRVVATLRDDFLHRLLADTRTPNIARQVFALGPPTRDGLRAALVAPVEAAGYRFEEPALVDEVVDGLHDSSTPLPLLQFVAERMWSSRDRRRRLVTRSGYAALGGLEGALAKHADRVVDGLPRRDYALVRRLFGFLVAPGRTRNRLRLDEPSALGGDQRRLDRIVAALVEGRLLDVHVDADGTRWAELVHESLITRWPRLQAWLSEADGDMVFEARVRAAAAQWSRAERSSGLIWRDHDARAAVRWSRRHKGTGIRARLGDDGAAYLEAVVRGAHGRRRRAQCALVIAIVGLLATTLTLAGLRAQADESARQAANWARVSVARNLEHDPSTMLAILREVEGEPPPTWSRLVRRALALGPARSVFSHPDMVSSVGWSADGRTIVTACADENLRIWRPGAVEAERTIAAHWITRLRLSPDGQRVVSAGKDGTARIWSLGGDDRPIVFDHSANVYQAVFAPDGRRVATASFDGRARVWSLADGPSIVLEHGTTADGAPTKVYGVAFSPDGERVATVALDGRLRLWSVDGGAPLATVDADDAPLISVDIAPDGAIVTASYDNHLRIWTPDAGRMTHHTVFPAPLTAVRFDREGQRIVAATSDGGVWLVPDRGSAPVEVGRHTELVHSVDFSPTGDAVVSASLDGSARIWAIGLPTRQIFERHTGPVVSVGVTAGGQISSAGEDGTVWLGPADGSAPPRAIYVAEKRLSAMTLSATGDGWVFAEQDRGIGRLDSTGLSPALLPKSGQSWITDLASVDGGRVAATDLDGRIWLWSDGAGAAAHLLGRHGDRALAVAADPQGRYLATGGADRAVRLWPLADGDSPRTLGVHPSLVQALAFDTTGRHLAVGTMSGAWLWTLDRRAAARRRLNQAGEVLAVAFSPDGRWVATAGTGLHLEPTDGGESIVLDEGAFTAVAFAPDGQSLIAGAQDGSVRIYRDLAPIEPESLWQLAHCPLPTARRALLGIDDRAADRQWRACRERVHAARSKSGSFSTDDPPSGSRDSGRMDWARTPSTPMRPGLVALPALIEP